MRTSSGHLIVISPDTQRSWKTRFTRGTLYAMAVTFTASFSAVLLIGFTFPPLVSDVDRIRLERENQSLRVETRDVELKMKRLHATVDRIETLSNGVAANFND
jgi:hypothetical protein